MHPAGQSMGRGMTFDQRYQSVAKIHARHYHSPVVIGIVRVPFLDMAEESGEADLGNIMPVHNSMGHYVHTILDHALTHV